MATVQERRRPQDLASVRDAFLATGRVPDGVRPVVAAAWVRCRALGVRPEGVPCQDPGAGRLEAARAANRALLAAAEPALLEMHRILADRPHLIALGDADGLILRLFATTAELERGRTGNLFEGASWAEADLGCNGIGTALHEGAPVVLMGAEHFVKDFVYWTCIGVPVRGPGGEVVGALDLSVPVERTSVHAWGWARSVARVIEGVLTRAPPARVDPRSEPPARALSAITGAASADTVRIAADVDDPFNAVRGVLEFLGREHESPAHAEVFEIARDQLETAEAKVHDQIARMLDLQIALEAEGHNKDAFLHMVAHELRTPASTLSLALELHDSEPSPETKDRIVRALRGSLPTLVRLADDLSDLSRARRGVLDLRLSVVGVRALLDQVVAGVRTLAGARRLEINGDGALLVRADPTRLGQVITNILINALRHTAGDGNVRVTCTGESDRVVVRIRDDGEGFPPELAEALFQPFHRCPSCHPEGASGDGAGATGHPVCATCQPSCASDDAVGAAGFGLGLALVRHLVEAHGGTVQARSDGLGCGAEFVLSLPAAS